MHKRMSKTNHIHSHLGEIILMPYNPPNDRNLVRRMRLSLGLTQDAFAKKLGYTRSFISQLERGHKPITQKLLNEIRWTMIENTVESLKQLRVEDDNETNR